MELTRRDFSISIPEARTIEDNGYFSKSSYTVFIVQTKSNLPQYKEKEVHIVERRFSEFEFLLSKLQEEYTNFVLPSLPEKKYIGSMDETFIKERREKLEGFLRHLMQIDQRIRADKSI